MLLRVLIFLGVLSLGLVGCDTSTHSTPSTLTQPATIPEGNANASSSAEPTNKPIRLPSLTIPPYTLPENYNTEPLPGLGEPVDTPQDLRLHYYVTTSNSYTDIVVEYGELHYTYFPDVTGKCMHWKKVEPCWTQHDLNRIGKILSQTDLDNLTTIVIENQVLELEKDDYGAKAKQRKDSESYTVFLDNTERNFTYYPSTDKKAEPKPEGLARIETSLLQYARDLEAETYSPLPAIPPSQVGAE